MDEPTTHAEELAVSADADAEARTPSGAEAYAYDRRLLPSAQVGLDRLRCVEDREIAGLLFKLYQHLERRELASAPTPTPTVSKKRAERWILFALDALAGKCGTEARELAEYFLKGDDGRDHLDEVSVEAFARGYEKLRAGTHVAGVSCAGRARRS